MHTHKSANGTVFNYNPDMSGSVTIIVETGWEKQFEVPVWDILEFVSEIIKKQRILQIKEMDVNQLLNL